MEIREATELDLDEVLNVERQAFGEDDEADLVKNLLEDASARPLLSLLAFDGEKAVGHVLFTSARLTDSAEGTPAAILAPLAVVPEAQKQGIGGKLIERGLQTLRKSGVELVFVLGHPGYYPRHGFTPAGKLGFEASYPIPDKDANAWMVQALRPNLLGSISGKVLCAKALDREEYWRE